MYIYFLNIKNYDKKYIGKELKKTCIQYGTLGIKIGQVFSNRTDLLDREICNILNDLRDNVPGLSDKENQILINTIKENIPCETINPYPIGAGCIAIVYEGIIKGGKRIVIKIKRPEIIQKLDNSMIKVEKLLYYVNYLNAFKDMELDKRLIELKSLIYEQIDFNNELKETIYFYNKYKKHHFIMTPKPYEEYSNDSMIVLEYINGKKIDDIDLKKKESISLPFTGFLISSMFIDGHYHGDLHSGNIMMVGNKLCIYDFGLVFTFNNTDKKMVYEYYLSLMNKQWEKSSDILLNHFCENKIKDEKKFKEDIVKVLVNHFEVNTKWDPVCYIRDISSCIKKHKSTMVKSFVSWELSMVTVQGVITEICKKNIWELCREINDLYDLN